MDENETVPTTDLIQKAKEAAVWGAVSALTSIAVTYALTSIIQKAQNRKNKTELTVTPDE